MAQEWYPPEASAVTPAIIGAMGVGVGVLMVTGSPIPSCPWLFKPRHDTPPVSYRRQVWAPPGAISTTASPPTPTGAVTLAVPVPICPNWLLPQHTASLDVKSAHTCSLYVRTEAAGKGRAMTWGSANPVAMPLACSP